MLLPEKEEDINGLCRKIIEGSNRGKLHSIIIKAEGTRIGGQELVDTIQHFSPQNMASFLDYIELLQLRQKAEDCSSTS